MVKFENFSRNGDILTADVHVCTCDVSGYIHAVYNMKTESLTVKANNVPDFVYRQCKKAFGDVSFNIRIKNKKYSKKFAIAWG